MSDAKRIAQRCADSMWRGDNASKALDIEVEVVDAGAVSATMRVRDDMLNGFQVIHGGLTFALADTAFAFACNGHNEQSFAASAQIEFLRPAQSGDVLTATAKEDYRGRRSGYYSVTVVNQREETVAIFRGRSRSNGEPVESDT